MNPSLPKQIKTLLCPEREVLIAHKDDKLKRNRSLFRTIWGLPMMRTKIEQQEKEKEKG